MTAVSYEVFLSEVMPWVRECPQMVAVNAIRNAGIQFCNQSHWLTYEPDPQTLLAGIREYDLEYESGVIPTRLIWAKINNFAVKGVVTTENTLVLPLVPVAREVNALTMKLAVQPTRTSTTVDQSIYDRWAEVIAHGALARLYDMPGQPFSDEAKGLLSGQRFRAGIAEARIERQREQTVGPLTVKMRRFV